MHMRAHTHVMACVIFSLVMKLDGPPKRRGPDHTDLPNPLDLPLVKLLMLWEVSTCI